ncbi:uncharacterized protein METZ01_LOCUS29535 [marine metagenome]|uniref:Uncharacterized protein n=1 Tax=marine metagenome TaxID=408172 RepID=A0A381QBH9_9ZZZZ
MVGSSFRQNYGVDPLVAHISSLNIL